MAAKRGAASELNDRNWDQEEEPEEAGTFVQATSEVMQARVVKRARRRAFNDEETGGGTKPAVFGGFSGLSKSSSAKSDGTATSTGGLSFGTGTATSTGGLSFGSSKPISFGGASSLNGGDNEKVKGRGSESRDHGSYLHALKSLNESVLSWIKQHVEDNPYIFLTPIFKDYQKHLDALESKKSPSSPAEGGAKESKNGDGGSAAKSSLPLATSFQFSAAKPDPVQVKEVKDEGDTSGKTPSFGLASPAEADKKPATVFGGLSSNGGFQFSTTSSTQGFAFSGSTSGASSATSAFGTGGKSFTFGSVGSSSAGSSSMFAGASSQGASQSTDSKEDEEYEPPKPEVREIKEDDALYSKRCKLYYQREGQWVDRGVGNIHLKPVEDTKTQLLIRADTNLGNILLNVMLSSSMPVSRQGKNNVMLVCVPSSGEESSQDTTPVPMLIRVKTTEDADDLFGKIDERKKLLS